MNNSGSAEAIKDWQTENVVYIHKGDLYHTEPIIDGSGFYLTSSWNDPKYINEYNAQVVALVKQYGLPDWAPGKRVLTKNEIVELLSQTNPLCDFIPENKKERILISNQSKIWLGDFSVAPKKYVRVPDQQIIVLIGEIEEGNLICFDQMDLRIYTWMNRMKCPVEN